jgi:hypothetical protein
MFASWIGDGFQHLDEGMQMRLGKQGLTLFFCESRKDTT